MMDLRPKESCSFDVVALGEVMLRFDPGEGRIRTARRFDVWEGGGEYNVARGLRRCFGQRAALVSSFVDNEVGALLEGLLLQGGVDLRFVRWLPDDGVGRAARNGLNFTERGFGLRPAKGSSDRGHTATSQMSPDDVDWEHLFGELGVRWFHTGGIFAALSETTPDVLETAMSTAKRHGTAVSYDLNYRPSLWQDAGGQRKAQEVNKRLAPYVDVMLGNEEDFTACLGFEVPDLDPSLQELETHAFKRMIADVTNSYANLSAVATTLRTVRTATSNDWGAVAWSQDGFVEATHRTEIEILDRVGGGDSFASGFIFGLLEGKPVAEAIEYGVAHGALAMTTPGDVSTASLSEVEALMAGRTARIQR